MSKITYTDSVVPFSGSTITLNGVEISGVAPSPGQILVATGPTFAQWQDPSSVSNTIEFLLNATNVNLPNSRELTASGGVTKTTPGSTVQLDLDNTAVTPGTYTNPELTSDTFGRITAASNSTLTENKPVVRVATTEAGTLASDFENGDTIDGVVLATGDRILIKNQVNEIENGIYTVNVSGAPTRSADLPAGSGNIAGGITVSVNEGNINAGQVFGCLNAPTVAEPGVDDLFFAQYLGTGADTVEVTTSRELIDALTSGIINIVVGPGEYIISNTITITGVAPNIIGYGFAPLITFNASSGALFNLVSPVAGNFENLRFNLTSLNSRVFSLSGAISNVLIRECSFSGRNFIQGLTGSFTDIIIDTCFLDCQSLGTSAANVPIDFTNSTRLKIRNSVIRSDITDTTVLIQGGSSNIEFNTCQLEGVLLQISNSSIVQFDSNVCRNCRIAVDTNSSDIAIINNYFFSNIGSPDIINLNTCSNVKISGNCMVSFSAITNNIVTLSATATTIRGNSFVNNTGTVVVIGNNSNNSLIQGNNSNFGNLVSVSGTGNDLVTVIANNNINTLTDPSSIDPYNDSVLIDKTVDPPPTDPIPLGNPTLGSVQKTIYILANSDTSGGGAPLYSVSYTGTTFTNIEFQSVNDYVVLRWTGSAWETLSSFGVVFS